MGTLAAALIALCPAADDPTWSGDVAAILFEHCVRCHRPGEAAPFPLLTAQDAADHADQIAQVTASRYMPPWLALPADPPFLGERRLTDEQIETLARWAEAEAPPGDPAAAPPPPSFTAGWQLGEPDLVLTMAEPFVLPADGVDVYRNFVLPVPVTTVKHVRGVEVRPGNARVVHHAAVRLDTGDSSRRLDARDPLPGFEEMETGEAASPDGHFIGWTPGRTPLPLPDGMSWRLPPESDVVLQLHLLPSGKEESVQSSVGLYFSDEPAIDVPVLLRLGSKAIDIPAGEREYAVEDRYVLPVDVDLHAIAPHAHFLGRSVSCAATLPDGSIRSLLEIPHWDFSWQDEFRCSSPVPLPQGTTLRIRWTFDNSDGNPRNPRDPPERARYGPSSLAEMCDVWFQVVPRRRADLSLLQRDYYARELELLRAGYEARIAWEPEDAEARLDLGLTLLHQGDVAGARRELERAVELDPGHVRARFQLGRVIARAKDAAGARAQFERVLALEPDHAGAMLQFGVLAETAGNLEDALAWYERAAAERPRLYVARVNFGRLLDTLGEDVEAAAEYEAALALDPGAKDVRCALAWLRATSPSAAARNGRQALELARAPLDSEASGPLDLDVLAAAQAECGRFKAAVETAARAAEAARRLGDAAFAASVDRRRALYARSQPYREAQPPARDGN